MKLKYYLIVALLLISSGNYFSQKKDSLDLKIENMINNQFSKIDSRDTDKKLQLLSEIEKLNSSRENNYTIFTYANRGSVFEQLGKMEPAIQNYRKALNISKKTKDVFGEVQGYQNLGRWHGKSANYDSAKFYLLKMEPVLGKPEMKENKRAQTSLIKCYQNLSNVAFLQRNFDESLKYTYKGLDLAKAIGNEQAQLPFYSLIGQNYSFLGKQDKAIENYNIYKNLAIKNNVKEGVNIANLNLAQAYTELKDYKNAEKYVLDAVNFFTTSNDFYNLNTAKQNLFSIYRLQKRYKEAHQMEDELIQGTKKLNRNLDHLYIDIAEIYTNEKNYSAAEKYFAMAEQELDSKNLNKRFFYKKKALYYKAVGDTNKSLEMMEKWKKNAEEEGKKQFDKTAIDYETKYKTSEKENQIARQNFEIKNKELKLNSQQLEIEKQKSDRNMALSGAVILGLLALGGALFSRNRNRRKELENKNTLLTLQQNLTEMELQNLNAQLSPHEMKSLLMTIAPEIQKELPQTYEKTIRLINVVTAPLYAQEKVDSIKNQLSMVDDYLSLFQNKVNYQIKKEADCENYQIPILMIKNLVDNSLKHAFKGRKEKGEILISVYETEKDVFVTVSDNGNGEPSEKRGTGVGLSNYAKMFDIYNKVNDDKAGFKFQSSEKGNETKIIIPKNYKYSLN